MRRDSNVRLLAEIDGRWEMNREVGTDIAKKPLVDSDEWRAIGEGLFREERVRDLVVEGEACGGSAPGWVDWNKKDTNGRRMRLGELCFYPRRRPVRKSTEELGAPKTEEIEDAIPESIDGVAGRNLNLVDMTRGPMLTIAEWNKLKTREMPCSKEEWRGMSTKNKWGALLNFGCAFHGPKGRKKSPR